MKTPADKFTERQRRQKLRELVAEMDAAELSQFASGTFGCHELLDRVLVLGNNVEQYVLDHPACVQNEEWYALANQAVKALRELYQLVGAAHLNGEDGAGQVYPNKSTRRKRTG